MIERKLFAHLVTPVRGDRFLWLLCIAAIMAVVTLAAPADFPIGMRLFAGGGGLVMVGGLVLMRCSRARRSIAAIREKGRMEELLADFERSEPVGGNCIRFGERFCYPRGGGAIVAYEEIQSVSYSWEQRDRSSRAFRSLTYCSERAGNGLICCLPDSPDCVPIIHEVLSRLLSRNPQIQNDTGFGADLFQ